MNQQKQEKKIMKIFDLQVSGKAPKFITEDEKMILKASSELQAKFYKYFADCKYTDVEMAIIEYIPKYFGLQHIEALVQCEFQQTNNQKKTQWLEHLKSRFSKQSMDHYFIAMENFTQGFSYPNIIDLKMQGKNEKVHKDIPVYQKYGIKLNGMHKCSKLFGSEFRTKYELNKISDVKQIKENIAWFFFCKEKKAINLSLVQKCITILKDLILCFRCAKYWSFISSSICMVYDEGKQESFKLKLIDFGRAKFEAKIENQDKFDKKTSKGMENLLQFIIQISEQAHLYRDMSLKNFEGEVIPDKKLSKYGFEKDHPQK